MYKLCVFQVIIYETHYKIFLLIFVELINYWSEIWKNGAINYFIELLPGPVIVFFYIFNSGFFTEILLSWIYFFKGKITLWSLPLYPIILRYLPFGITGSFLANKHNAFWGVETCNLVDYLSFVGETVT
jgi:hypothetical protein